jgi:hypothetical protein
VHDASRSAEEDRLEYFESMHRGFDRAAAAAGRVDRFVAIAGHTVRLQFAGPLLAPVLSRALAHLAIEPGPAPPDLTISIWETASTGTELPLLVQSLVTGLRDRWWESLDRRREIRGYDGTRIRTSFFLGPDILSALDLETGRGLYWIESESRVPYWEKGSPFLALLSWWTASRGWHYVHAGAVGHSDGGLLLAGRGGSGKSTTALCSLESGRLKYASDDYCLVHPSPQPTAASIYSSAKLKGRADFARFPALEARCTNLDRVGEEKALLFLHEAFPERFVPGFPIRAVVLPHVEATAQTSLSPASAADALKALAPSTMMQVPGAGPALLLGLRRMVSLVPSFHLRLGRDVDRAPELLADLLTSRHLSQQTPA